MCCDVTLREANPYHSSQQLAEAEGELQPQVPSAGDPRTLTPQLKRAWGAKQGGLASHAPAKAWPLGLVRPRGKLGGKVWCLPTWPRFGVDGRGVIATNSFPAAPRLQAFLLRGLVTQNLPCLPTTSRSSPSAAPLIPRSSEATLSSHFCPYPELFTWAKLTPLLLQDGGSPHPQAASSRGTCPPRLPSPHPTVLGSPSIGLTTSLCGELLCLRPWTPERMAVSLRRVQLPEFTLVCPSTCLTLPASKGGTEESQARLCQWTWAQGAIGQGTGYLVSLSFCFFTIK